MRQVSQPPYRKIELEELSEEKERLVEKLDSLGEKLDVQTEKYNEIEREATVQEKKLKHAESLQKAMLDDPQITPLGMSLPKPRAPKNYRSKSLLPNPLLFSPSNQDETKETDPDHAELVSKFMNEFAQKGTPITHASMLEVPEQPEDDICPFKPDPMHSSNNTDSERESDPSSFDRRNHSKLVLYKK